MLCSLSMLLVVYTQSNSLHCISKVVYSTHHFTTLNMKQNLQLPVLQMYINLECISQGEGVSALCTYMQPDGCSPCMTLSFILHWISLSS